MDYFRRSVQRRREPLLPAVQESPASDMGSSIIAAAGWTFSTLATDSPAQ